MERKLPEKLFVKWNHDTDEAYLECTVHLTSISEQEQKTKIGMYRLVETAELVNKSELKNVRKV